MAAPQTSKLLPIVDCELVMRGFYPNYHKHYNVNNAVHLTIKIEEDKETNKLPIQESHPVKVAVWIECNKNRVSVFESPEKPLKEYDGGREGKIEIPEFHPLPFHVEGPWHHLQVEVTPKGHQPFFEENGIRWDRDKLFPWVDREIKRTANTARDAYIDNRAYLTNIVNLMRASKACAYHFDFHKKRYQEFWASMTLLKQNVNDTMVEIKELEESKEIITYNNQPDGKPVRPVRSSFLITENIFKTETEYPPACLEIGYRFPLCLSIDFDRPHPKGSMCDVFVHLFYKPEKDATGDARKRERDEWMYTYKLGKHFIWFNDHNRRNGLVKSNDSNWVELRDEKRKLKTGRYFLDIAVQSEDWTEQVTYTSKIFPLTVLPGSGKGQSST